MPALGNGPCITSRSNPHTMTTNCPCGSEKKFADCCEPLIKGIVPAPTAEALMRSRYSAYVTENIDYLKITLSRAQQKDFTAQETARWARESQWQGLEIHSCEDGGEGDETGMVEFSARFSSGGSNQTHYEQAEFVREEGAWRYDGTRKPVGQTVRRTEPKVGRNDPCPCGSGKKYKRCCGLSA